MHIWTTPCVFSSATTELSVGQEVRGRCKVVLLSGVALIERVGLSFSRLRDREPKTGLVEGFKRPSVLCNFRWNKVILKVMISTRENDLDQEIEIEKINALTLQNSISLK